MVVNPGSVILRRRCAQAPALNMSRDTALQPIRHIALLGNFLPRLCGIATFTTHVHDALTTRWPGLRADVYAMVDPGRHYDFPPAVAAVIDQENARSYRGAAERINESGAELLWIQHEFGIFGGSAGDLLLGLLSRVSIPVALTLHTVLECPDRDQRRVLEQLASTVATIIVMAEKARRILIETYAISPAKIAVIEHGVPDRGYVAPAAARHCFGYEDHKTIMTFGLLSPDKGIETMIRAMPAILHRCPGTLYRIVGATHPHLVAHEGERHRDMLKALADELGVAHALHWEERFLCEDALLDRLATADIYVTPYRNPRQITSGTLSYAFGLGKPIVSTPYIHATELLADNRGRLVGFDDDRAMADAISSLLIDDAARCDMAAGAYRRGRAFTWGRMVDRALGAFVDRSRAPAIRPVSSISAATSRAPFSALA